MKRSFFKKRSKHLRTGRRGEKIAVKLLKAKQYSILVRNYSSLKGEIDIVARDGGILVFVEVKTRSSNSRTRPAEGLR